MKLVNTSLVSITTTTIDMVGIINSFITLRVEPYDKACSFFKCYKAYKVLVP